MHTNAKEAVSEEIGQASCSELEVGLQGSAVGMGNDCSSIACKRPAPWVSMKKKSHCITWSYITVYVCLPTLKQDLKKHSKTDHAESRSEVHQRQHGRTETGSKAELGGGLFFVEGD